jgi:hypothetical protein
MQQRRSRGFRLPHDKCSAYCRGERHADVFWLLKERHEGLEAAALTELCEGYGVRFVAAVPATEAPWRGATTGFDPEDGGGWLETARPSYPLTPSDYTAWLLTWEEPWPEGLAREEVA